jgi:prepilin-type N-terminal cleavage/methylation domain-containing protein
MKGVRSEESGFVMLEVIIAMVVVSIALATLYRTVGGAFNAAGRTETMRATTVFARSHLDGVGISGKLAAGTTTGAYSNGIRWRLSIADLSTKLADASALRPYWVTLVAVDRSGVPLLRLETAKIAREAAR